MAAALANRMTDEQDLLTAPAQPKVDSATAPIDSTAQPTPAPAPDPVAKPKPNPAMGPVTQDPNAGTPGTGAIADSLGTSSIAPTQQAAPPAATAPAAAPAPAAPLPAAAGTTPMPDPTLRSLDEQKDTVAGRLSTLMNVDNPIIAQARANAIKTANDRGLVNSSMAAQAGEEAAVSSMLPVAQADAAASLNQGELNQNTENQFKITGATFEHQDTMQGKDIASNQRIAQLQADSNVQAAGIHASAAVAAASIGAEASKSMQQAAIASNERMQQTDGAIRAGLLNTQIAANSDLFDKQTTFQRELSLQQAQVNTQANYTSQYNSILNNTNMASEDKTNAILHLNAIYGGSPYMPPGVVLPGYAGDPSAGPTIRTGPPVNTASGG